MGSEVTDWANKYLSRGWSVFPVNISSVIGEKGEVKKKIDFPPSWKQYENKLMNQSDVGLEWFGFNQMAVVTGKISGLTVIDLDTKDVSRIPAELWETYVVESRQGYHLYFKYDQRAKQSQDKGDIHVRNDGGCIFAPPSEYELPDGKVTGYKVISPKPLAPFPYEWYEKEFGDKDRIPKNWKDKIATPISQGNRNIDFTSIVGGMLSKHPQDDWEKVVWPPIRALNQTQMTPLSEKELRTIFESISKKEATRRTRGGPIKDIAVEKSEDGNGITIKIILESAIVCMRTSDLVTNLLEADVLTWIQKPEGITHSFPFSVKLKSDSNKELWVRTLTRAFDHKENNEVYQWTILTALAAEEIKKCIREIKQDYRLSEITPKNPSWLLEPFIMEDELNTFFGLGGCGKTTIAIYLASIIKQNGRGETMFIDYENTKEHFAANALKIYNVPDWIVHWSPHGIPTHEQVDKLRDAIARHKTKFLIVDSASVATGNSTSDEGAALKFMSALQTLVVSGKVTILVLAHQRKNDGERTPIGSIQFENQTRNEWHFEGRLDDIDRNILHVSCDHRKHNNTYKHQKMGYRLTWNPDSTEISQEDSIDNFEDKFPPIDRMKVLLKNNPGISYREIAKLLEMTAPAVNSILSRGKMRGFFKNNDKGEWSLT